MKKLLITLTLLVAFNASAALSDVKTRIRNYIKTIALIQEYHYDATGEYLQIKRTATTVPADENFQVPDDVDNAPSDRPTYTFRNMINNYKSNFGPGVQAALEDLLVTGMKTQLEIHALSGGADVVGGAAWKAFFRIRFNGNLYSLVVDSRNLTITETPPNPEDIVTDPETGQQYDTRKPWQKWDVVDIKDSVTWTLVDESNGI